MKKNYKAVNPSKKRSSKKIKINTKKFKLIVKTQKVYNF